MFSSFTSFLPSALQINGNSHDNRTTTPPPKPTFNSETVQEYRKSIDDVGAKKGATSKVKSVHETFIVVRPPPAKSNHPLNLQVQLVPPTSRTARQSLDDSDAASTSTSLTRTASNRSDNFTYGSTTSFSSTTSASSARRTIIPLYNLQAHNVMANTIVDAGTDAKIARFQKRGIELIDLAILEPVEVWGESGRGKTSRPVTPEFAPTARSSAISLQSHSPHQPPSQLPSIQPTVLPNKRNNIFGKLFKKSSKDSSIPPASPLGSAFTTSSQISSQDTANVSKHSLASPMPTRTAPARGHNHNLSATLSPSTIAGKLRNRSASPNPPTPVLGLNVPEDNASVHSSSNADHSNTVPSDEKVLRPPILGIQPSLSYAYGPSSCLTISGPVQPSSLSKNARALMYVWFVRKWLKRKERTSFLLDEEGGGRMLGKIRGSAKAQGSLSASAVVSEGVEVRFEWRRHGGKVKARRGRLSARRSHGSLIVPDADGDEEDNSERDREKETETERRRFNRLSVTSHHSMSTNMSVSEEGSPRRERTRTRAQGSSKTRDKERRVSRDGRDRERDLDGDDAGEDSDPEDSETPWVCTLKIRKAGGLTAGAGTSRSRTQQGDGVWVPAESETLMQPQVVRIKVGTLSPTPHHPKVVAMLKVPFPLPDVEVERMGVRKRPMGQRPATLQWGGTTLTAEEIKDVVCSTAMWLVVRESFGGIGKVTRRGDGWRIRA
ncbi:hypothetical protein L208DRAFT_1400632 [Tricholoma matsutake]|nr:hypothetical protein L208DRAFT_1400632 [Tricholoma matsutake 945]